MVLEKDSSVLGYPGEVSKPLDADHHTVCKFDGTNDPNYITVRNYLKSHMAKLFTRQGSRASVGSGTPLETRDLEAFFAITDLSDTDYIFFRDRWTPGTCEWVLENPAFVRWLDPIAGGPQLLWLHGPGGSGKSVLASFIVNHLVQAGLCCQYVFTRISDQGKHSLSWILRSLGFQMAQVLPSFRNALGGVSRGLKLRGADPRTIWQRVFKAAMLRIELAEPIYWIVDGLDECDNARQAVKLFSEVLQAACPIRILVLSRPSADIEAELRRVPSGWEGASLNEHADDFHVFIEQELEWADIPEFKEKIKQQLLDTAQGNFLWLRLTVDRINKCHTEEDVDRALQELPPGMEELFDRVAQSISTQDDTDRALTTNLLSWATCSFRPLTVLDLSQALQPEAPRVLNLQRTIGDLCGGFLVVDNGDTVAMVHQAAREYLLNSKDRPFRLDKKACHEKLLLRCLAFLSTPGLRAKISHGEELGLLSYAASYWAAHLQASSRASQNVCAAVVKFLRSPSVLTWIQAVAQAGDLHFLVQASTHLSSFAAGLGRVNADKMPLDHHVAEQDLIKGWATDLSKIVGKFGSQLLRNPDNIYRAIPPFCPPDSAIFRQFGGRDARNIIVSGSTATGWDDGVARLSFRGRYQATTILAEGPWVVVATLRDNATTVFVYRADTYQEVRRITHAERVRKIQVNSLGTLLITCGYLTTKVWDLSNGICLAHATNPTGRPRPQAVTFVKDDTCVLISSEDRRIWLLPIAGQDSVFEQMAQIMDRNVGGGLVNSPACAAISPDGRLMALGYRKSPLSVWEVEGMECLARCPELERLQEIIWHPFTGEILGMHTGGVVFKWEPDGNDLIKVPIGASTMAISPKGNLLATGDMRGNISLLSTSDLGLVYRAVCQDPVIGISFSTDSLQLYDIRQTYGNIWEPNVLLKLSEPVSQSDTGSESDTLGSQPSLSETLYDKVDPVTALSPQSNGQLFCTGSEEGVVAIHSPQHNNVLELRRSDSFMGIEQVEWNDDGTLVCAADLGRTISVHHLRHVSGHGVGWDAEAILEMSVGDLDGNIDQVVFQPQGDLLLVCNSQSAVVISITEKEVVAAQNIGSSGGRWIAHPFSKEHLILFSPSAADIYTWETLDKVASIPLVLPFEEYTTYNTVQTEPGFGSEFTSHSPCKDAVTTQTAASSASVQKLFLSSSRQHILMRLAVQIDEQPRSVVRLLDLTLLNGFPAKEPPSMGQDTSDLGLDSETLSITSIEIPEEVVDRIYRPLSFITTRGSNSEMLLFLDYNSSICSWSARRSSISSRTSHASPPLSRTISSPARPASTVVLPQQSPPLKWESVSSLPGSPRWAEPSRRGSVLSTSASSLPFESSRRGSAVSISGSQAQITSHYCLPSDWVSPDCVNLLQTLGDGTLLCPRNGQVSVVRCRTLSG
jgi:hypothetical protein